MESEKYIWSGVEVQPDWETFTEHLESAETLEELVWLAETYDLPDKIVKKLSALAGSHHDGQDYAIENRELNDRAEKLYQQRQSLNKLFNDSVQTIAHIEDPSLTTITHTIDASSLSKILNREIDQPSILILPGFTSAPKNLRHLATDLAQKGHPSIFPETIVPKAQVPNLREEESYGIRNTQLVNAHAGAAEAALCKHLENNRLDKVDVVAHSIGAISAIALALKHPEKIRSVVLIDPAGLSQLSDNTALNALTVPVKASAHLIQSALQKTSPIFHNFVDDIYKRQRGRGLMEIIKIIIEKSSTHLQEAVAYLTTEKGIPIAVLPSENDQLLNPNRTHDQASEAGAESFMLTGMHTTIGRSGRAAPIIHDTLLHINEKKEHQI